MKKQPTTAQIAASLVNNKIPFHHKDGEIVIRAEREIPPSARLGNIAEKVAEIKKEFVASHGIKWFAKYFPISEGWVITKNIQFKWNPPQSWRPFEVLLYLKNKELNTYNDLTVSVMWDDKFNLKQPKPIRVRLGHSTYLFRSIKELLTDKNLQFLSQKWKEFAKAQNVSNPAMDDVFKELGIK